MKKYNLIFLRTGKILLSQRSYQSWEEIQELYDDYQTSLDFESLDDVNEWLFFEYQLEKEHIVKMTAASNLSDNDLEIIF